MIFLSYKLDGFSARVTLEALMWKLNTATDLSMCLPPLRMALVAGYLLVTAPEKT